MTTQEMIEKLTYAHNILDRNGAIGTAKELCAVISALQSSRIVDKECCWEFHKSDSRWDSSCGHSYCFFESDPKENHYEYCPYCGGIIKLAAIEKENKE